MNNDNIFMFKATIKKCRYNSEDFKIYVADIDEAKYKNIKLNSAGQLILTGNMPNLIPDIEYEFTANKEYNTKFGVQYKVISLRRDLNNDENSSRKFLNEILTEKQTNTLLEVYPNIIKMIMDGEDVDLSKTKGIKEKTFEDIKAKIIENYVLISLVDKYGGTLSMSIIKKLYDRYQDVRTIERKLNENPYKALCDISRVGFKSADAILQKLEADNKISFNEPLVTSISRMYSCIEYVLQQEELKGNSCVALKTLRSECEKLTPECIYHFVECIKSNNDKVYVDMSNKLVGLKSTRNKELYIYNKLNKIQQNCKKWSCESEVYRGIGEFSLTDEQLHTIDMICNNGVGILTAAGGSGKSASVQALVEMCDDKKLTYKMMTPTGASSKVLSQYSKKECSTIHRGLGFGKGEEGGFEFNENNKISEDLVIIDEFSMCDINLFYNLLKAIDEDRTKLLLVFDPYQLPSVGVGNLAQDLLISGRLPVNRLTKIFRYAEGGLMNIATSIRNSQQFLTPPLSKYTKVFGDNKDFVYFEKQEKQILEGIVYVYKNLLAKGYGIDDIMVLTAQNKGDYGTIAINRLVQSLIQKGNNNNFIMRGDTKFFLDDKVIQVKNNYKPKLSELNKSSETAIFNGNTGIVTKVCYDKIEVTFDDDLVIEYEKEDLDQLELGYCITIHKSQGSAAKQVIVVAPRQHAFNLNSNLLYVGVTRSKERCFMIGNITTINRAIKKKENLSRKTWANVFYSEILE